MDERIDERMDERMDDDGYSYKTVHALLAALAFIH